MEIVIAIVTTILGAVLGVLASRWDSWRQTVGRGDLRGDWLSLSHGGDHEIVKDTINVSRKRGKLYFKNGGNEYGYLYNCHCSIESHNIVTGTWRSLRQGASARGRVLLVANAQGTAMHGVYSGKTSDGKDVILGWVLTRTPDELDQAAKRLKAMLGFPSARSVLAQQHVQLDLGVAARPLGRLT